MKDEDKISGETIRAAIEAIKKAVEEDVAEQNRRRARVRSGKRLRQREMGSWRIKR